MPKFIKNYLESLKAISASARIYLVGLACLGVAQGSFWALANLYYKHIDLNEQVIGWIISLRMLPTLLIALPVAKVLTRFRMKSVLMIGAVWTGVSYAGLVITGEARLILAFSFMLGCANGIIMLAIPIFSMRNSSTAERVHLFGLGFAVRMGAGALGSLGGGWLMKALAESMDNPVIADRYVLLGFAVVATAAVIPFFLLREKKGSVPENERRKLWPPRKPRLVAKLCVPEVFIGMGAGSFIPWINLYFKQVFGQDEAGVGTYYAMMRGVNFFAFMYAPVLAKKLGLLRSVVFTQFMSFPFLVVMGYSLHLFGLVGIEVPFALIVVAFLCRGALMNMAQPLAANFALEMVPEDDRALMNSVRRMAWNGAFAVSSLLAGTVITWAGDTYGEENAFNFNVGFCILMYIASASSNYLLFRKYPRKLGIADTVPTSPRQQ